MAKAKSKGRGQLSGMPTPKFRPALMKVSDAKPNAGIGKPCGTKMIK